jgi:hypothetical protein
MNDGGVDFWQGNSDVVINGCNIVIWGCNIVIWEDKAGFNKVPPPGLAEVQPQVLLTNGSNTFFPQRYSKDNGPIIAVQ